VEEATGVAPTAASPTRTWRWGALSICALLLFAAAGWILYRRQATPQQQLQALPLTTEFGTELCPSLSPDGNQVAFEWTRGSAGPHIYVKLVGPGDPVRLTSGSESEYGPAWSRDGKQIAFIRMLDPNRVGVFVIPALGGVERKLTEFANSEIYYWRNTHRWLDWTPDGNHLIASGAEDPYAAQALFVVPLDGGPRRRLTTPPAANRAGDRSPAVSPDGRVVAFARALIPINAELYLLPVTRDLSPAAEPRQLTNHGGSADAPAWLPDGRELLYTVGVPVTVGGLGIWRIGVGRDSTPRRQDTAGHQGTFPSLAPNGRLAISESRSDSNIWRQEVMAGAAAASSAVRLIASSVADSNPQYSPDGKRIAFASNRSGRPTIWICEQDGTRCFELEAVRMATAGTPRWSPDGKKIAFDGRKDGAHEVYVINVDGGAPRLLTGAPPDNSIPSWSRDGKWIYFRSARTGRNEIWKVPSTGARRSRSPAMAATWRSNRRTARASITRRPRRRRSSGSLPLMEPKSEW